jgi:hypothetical protein
VNTKYMLCNECSDCRGCGEPAINPAGITPGKIQVRKTLRGNEVVCMKCDQTGDYQSCSICPGFAVTGLEDWIDMGTGKDIRVCIWCMMKHRTEWEKKGYKNVTNNHRCVEF